MIYPTISENFKPHFSIACCLVECEGKILLLYRNKNKSQGGRWGLPGGKKEQNESSVETVKRELEEETGVVVENEQCVYVDTIHAHHDGHDFEDTTFVIRFSEFPYVQLKRDEHTDFGWFSPQESLELNLVDDLDTYIRTFYKV